jgi:hypothetical protein
VKREEIISNWELELLLFVTVELGNVEVSFTKDHVLLTVGDGQHFQVESLVLNLIPVNVELREHGHL